MPVSGVQSIELPPPSLMRRPAPVPLLTGKTARYRDVERLAIQRGKHGAYMRQWVIALQYHTLDVAETKNGGDWNAHVEPAHRYKRPAKPDKPGFAGM